MTFLWDFYQHQQIDAARKAQTSLEAGQEKNLREVERLRDRIDALTLTNVAMWTLLRDKLGLTDAQLEARVTELDLADGTRDSKMGLGAWKCGACTRPNSRRHARCLYCGADNPKPMVFPL